MDATTLLDPAAVDLLAPEVRSDALVREYGTEAVVWSPEGTEPLYLDPVAAMIYRFLDGETTIAELVEDVRAAVGVPETVARNRIRDIVAGLDDAVLLTTSRPDEPVDEHLEIFPGPPNN